MRPFGGGRSLAPLPLPAHPSPHPGPLWDLGLLRLCCHTSSSLPPSFLPSALLHMSAPSDTYVAFGVCQRGSTPFLFFFHLFHFPPSFCFVFFFFPLTSACLPRISASAISSYPSVALFSPSPIQSPHHPPSQINLCSGRGGGWWGAGWGLRCGINYRLLRLE